jgi:hypothetical protein
MSNPFENARNFFSKASASGSSGPGASGDSSNSERAAASPSDLPSNDLPPNDRSLPPGAFYHLDLHLERGEEGNVSSVRQSPAGQGENRFVAPFSERDLQKVWDVLREVQNTQRVVPTQRALVQDAGRRLFEAVFSGEVLGCLRASFDQAIYMKSSLHVHLDLSGAPELEKLPWEYMYNPERSEFLTLASTSPVARFTGLQHRILPVKVVQPLRVLVVVSGPSSYPRVDADREWLNLLDSVDFLGAEGKMVIERLQKPTLLDLQRKLRQNEYHIVHFIGHGVADKATGEGQLVFEDETGRSRLVNGQHLGALMRDHFSLRFMCLTGPTRTGVGTEYAALLDVARKLVRRGVAAAVAPQLRVTQPAWLAFCQTLYRGLANIQPVDKAMVEARQAMAQESEDFGWGAPVFFSRCLDGHLFDDGTLPKEALPDDWDFNVASRLNSLRIRTASRETMSRWGRDADSSPRKRGW